MYQNRTERRWDTDTVGHGLADGSTYAPGVQRLLDALHMRLWVAEEPDVHLLPHLQQACEDAPWQLETTTFSGGVYVVALVWCRPNGHLARLRRDMFSLMGAIAEGVTYVHQQVTPDSIRYEVVTGLLDGDTQWRSHGHLIQFRVEGEAAQRLLRLMAHSVSEASRQE